MKKDFRGLAELKSRLAELGAMEDAFLMQCARDLAAQFLAEVKKKTPVGEGVYETDKKTGKRKNIAQGGTLRRMWRVESVTRRGDVYATCVINPVQYASYVEYGHRQQPGRYVPAIGKRLVRSWVEGKHMMTLSAEEIQSRGDEYVRQRFYLFLKQVMK